jgi:pimeloyl-ACP methyl ester carboxylesterase
MAERIQLLKEINFETDCLKVTAPTLIITGEPHLDRVVPVSSTKEFLHLIPHAVSATLGRTGHIGIISRPEDFAGIVEPFVAAHDF